MSRQGNIRTILIHDEQEDIRIVCHRGRSDLSHVTRSIPSGWKSLQYVDRNPEADLLILDFRMPRTPDLRASGRRSRCRKQSIPVILYSRGSAQEKDLPTWLVGLCRAKSSDLKEFKNKVKEFVRLEERLRYRWDIPKPCGRPAVDSSEERFPCRSC